LYWGFEGIAMILGVGILLGCLIIALLPSSVVTAIISTIVGIVGPTVWGNLMSFSASAFQVDIAIPDPWYVTWIINPSYYTLKFIMWDSSVMLYNGFWTLYDFNVQLFREIVGWLGIYFIWKFIFYMRQSYSMPIF
jgi:hypothetical protein